MQLASSDIFGYSEEEYVSSDIIGMTYASLFDATQTIVCPIRDNLYEVRVAAWFDNENSFCQSDGQNGQSCRQTSTVTPGNSVPQHLCPASTVHRTT